MSGGTWPPSGISATTQILPSYLYVQYNDDQYCQAQRDAFNTIAQQFLNWFNEVPLGVYTNANISGALLDWVAQGLYGIIRPSLPYGSISTIGPLNTWPLSSVALNTTSTTGSVTLFTTTDDIFKRIITWHFFKGDGQQFSIPWLKRRIMRFLIGTNGTAPNIDRTYQVSVVFDVDAANVITITWSGPVSQYNAQIFQAAVQSGAVELPFQFTWSVTLVGSLANLTNTAGAATLVSDSGWPTSSSGLVAGQLWWNGTNIEVVAGATPNPYAAPMVFGGVTSQYLLLIGGQDLPTSNPGAGSMILWNSGGTVLIA